MFLLLQKIDNDKNLTDEFIAVEDGARLKEWGKAYLFHGYYSKKELSQFIHMNIDFYTIDIIKNGENANV